MCLIPLEKLQTGDICPFCLWTSSVAFSWGHTCTSLSAQLSLHFPRAASLCFWQSAENASCRSWMKKAFNAFAFLHLFCVFFFMSTLNKRLYNSKTAAPERLQYFRLELRAVFMSLLWAIKQAGAAALMLHHLRRRFLLWSCCKHLICCFLELL